MTKLTITNDTLEQARNETPTSIALTVNTTGLGYREQADMLLSLAQQVGALADQQEEAERVRAAMAARGLSTETRLTLESPEVIKLYGPKGDERGLARFVVLSPLAPVRPRRRASSPSPRGVFPNDMPLFDDEEDEDEEVIEYYEEDDDVEFRRPRSDGSWHKGVFIDGGMGLFIVEDDYGRRWRVTAENIRKPLEW